MTKEGAAGPGEVSDQKTLGTEARGLIRRAMKAALATTGSPQDAPTEGWPANALVTVACAPDGSPILLLSTLAHHTRNILADPRASLLIEATDRFANPQAGPRVAAMGRVSRTDDPSFARRFLARHPAALAYAAFGDFAFYRMDVARFHFVGGFARARWIAKDDAVLGDADCGDIAAAEEAILAHMNGDHAETLLLYAQHVFKTRASRVRLIAVDPEGFDLRCGRAIRRIDFPQQLKSVDQIRAAFVSLAQQARASS